MMSESDDELALTPTSGGTTLANPSRRSSLESAEERELRVLQSRPSTAYSGLHTNASLDVTSLAKSPRHQPSDGEEEEEGEGEGGGEGRRSRSSAGERRERQPMEVAFKQMLLSPRRMSITRWDTLSVYSVCFTCRSHTTGRTVVSSVYSWDVIRRFCLLVCNMLFS